MADNHPDHVESVPGIPEVIQNIPSEVLNKVSDKMVVLTWIAFIIAAVCLHKLLWKRILGAVEKREQDIDEALQGAANARQTISAAEADRQKTIRKTEQDVRTITDEAKRRAEAIVAKAEADARAVSQRRVAEAEQVIEIEYRKAFEEVRHTAADNITRIIERLLGENLTDEQKRAYHEKMLKEVQL